MYAGSGNAMPRPAAYELIGPRSSNAYNRVCRSRAAFSPALRRERQQYVASPLMFRVKIPPDIGSALHRGSALAAAAAEFRGWNAALEWSVIRRSAPRAATLASPAARRLWRPARLSMHQVFDIRACCRATVQASHQRMP